MQEKLRRKDVGKATSTPLTDDDCRAVAGRRHHAVHHGAGAGGEGLELEHPARSEGGDKQSNISSLMIKIEIVLAPAMTYTPIPHDNLGPRY